MDVEITNEKVDFLREALYRHARQVNDYFNSARVRIDSYDGELQKRHKDEFLVRAQLLLSQLEQLIKCAGKVRTLSRMVNLEQLEAVVDRLSNELESTAA